MQQLYLTRRNLVTLLSKLDRCKADGPNTSACTIVKSDTLHWIYPCTDIIRVTALENEAYYTDREAGKVWPEDEPSGED
jgi:hypothetical protein